jgi:arylformamidase
MNIIDISWPISPTMTTYKNESKVLFNAVKTMERNAVRKTELVLDTHTGTHIDMPSHFIQNGITSEKTELESLFGPCVVIDLSHVEGAISATHLEEYDFEECDVVLIKTKNSTLAHDAPFNTSCVYLDASAAEYFAETTDVQTVGFDYIGIERNQPNHETHTTLFNAQITVIEGLRLSHVAEGEYFFVCLPLAVQGLDGAPARAILVEGL